MASRVRILPKENLLISCPPWWNSNEQQFVEIVTQNVSLKKAENHSQLYHNAKRFDLQLLDHEPTLAEAGVTGVNNSQCNSSESGQVESCRKDIEGQTKPVYVLNNPNTLLSPSHPNYNHSMACAQYPYTDAYFTGLFTPYGQQTIMTGTAPTRIPLPLDLAEDEPIYVNPKQYHGILRRRRHRAKLETRNKLVKSRKPYLHESRHLHAMNRIRGSGGRFLSKKKPQRSDPTSIYISDIGCLDQKDNNRSELESCCSHTAEYGGSCTSCSHISSITNNGGHISRRAVSSCNGIQNCASLVR
ncbi:hypothetical protein ES319_D07G013400v1 [Gossypium barbadense]|uniref:Nuclear transcription factor Y subunit n=2 Tax=Gossypium TaxID=3633 RepID=A0A5J5QMN9_GOSBA|nr:hypothetical protein ES319_D07G013400v1 [Gossypium barbadense]TYG59796.1 hypothetical protein ES288_D07G014800v1 [Gossypium darwinii]KAB2019685.1 hypothetical protein ES319_D07G013400v1 [Gossypium barbadense]KAB2019686.1 hypothetical protein ES319_D07G013400v1 [Gossypium barbadense]PPD96993.1 hypothetical protein GOBAR_DD05942 [Gossypium barbadense]